MIKHNSFGGYDSGYVNGYNKALKDMRNVIEDIKAEIDHKDVCIWIWWALMVTVMV